MILPCKHQEQVTRQVQPAIDLLTKMDVVHPDILLQHDIQPADYRNGLVFRSAIESIRGTFIVSSTTGREGLIGDVLENMLQKEQIADYEQTGSSRRYDFIVVIQKDPDYIVAIEVKGGEGNSINISERPLWAKEFCVWCHLDGAIVNQPAHGAHSILNRLTNELVRRHKSVDALFFKDILCGTRTRPCPKYPGQEDTMGLHAAPDIFLFPKRVPSLEDPEPPVHTLDSLKLPGQILDLFDVDRRSRDEHVWEVHVSIEELSNGRIQRNVLVRHKGDIVDESRSRAWRP
jgi:hypothetical protein